jgi:hypothetical protein
LVQVVDDRKDAVWWRADVRTPLIVETHWPRRDESDNRDDQDEDGNSDRYGEENRLGAKNAFEYGQCVT